MSKLFLNTWLRHIYHRTHLPKRWFWRRAHIQDYNTLQFMPIVSTCTCVMCIKYKVFQKWWSAKLICFAFISSKNYFRNFDYYYICYDILSSTNINGSRMISIFVTFNIINYCIRTWPDLTRKSQLSITTIIIIIMITIIICWLLFHKNCGLLIILGTYNLHNLSSHVWCWSVNHFFPGEFQ